MTTGERIKQAREMRGIAQKDFAQSLGVSPSYVARLEAGTSKASEERLESIALLTGFGRAFFRQEAPPELPIGSLLYRARAATPAAEKTRAHRYTQIMFEVAERLSQRVTEIPLRLPQLGNDLVGSAANDTIADELLEADDILPINPITAARVTRAEFGLSPATPITHLIYELERAGVLILAMPTVLTGIDAFSLWAQTNGRKPIIAVPTGVLGDRLRFSVAHELGHLVMHRAPKGTLTFIEKEANLFAGEFLLPEQAMKEEIIPPVTLTNLARLKLRWKVSIQMLLMRARDLRIVSEYNYRYLYEQLGAYGWRTREPSNLDVPAERPRYIRQVAEMLYGRPLDYQRLADDIQLPISLTKEIIEAYAGSDGEKTHVEGGNTNTAGTILPFPRR